MKKFFSMRSKNAPELSEPIKTLRGKYLKRVADEPLEDALLHLNGMLTDTEERQERLGNLAAQTWIVRRRFEAVLNGEEKTVADTIMPVTKRSSPSMTATDAKEILKQKMKPKKAAPQESDEDAIPSDWVRIRTLKEAEVNGLVFFENSILQVKPDDAKWLLDDGLAEIVADENDAEDATKKTKKAKSKTETPNETAEGDAPSEGAENENAATDNAAVEEKPSEVDDAHTDEVPTDADDTPVEDEDTSKNS